MKARFLVAAFATLGLAAPALADTPAKTNVHANCFLSQDWSNWRGSGPSTIYIRVHVHDYFKVELSSPSSMVTDPSNHLVSQVRGTPWICSPLDLDLKVSDGHVTEPLFVKSLTKLTPEQVAAIPPKDKP
jgi:hypothetical protein